MRIICTNIYLDKTVHEVSNEAKGKKYSQGELTKEISLFCLLIAFISLGISGRCFKTY